MNIKIEFIGFPVIYDLFPAGPHLYTISGNMLIHLVNDLIARHDPRVKESLLEPGTGTIDPTVQIMINQKLVPKTEMQEQKVGEGDHITFLKLLAGG